MSRLRSLLALSPAKITASYVVFGTAWILISDSLVNHLFESGRLLSQIQMLKGWVFVGLSGALIFGLTKLRHDQVAETEAHLRESNQQLQVVNRVLRHNIRNDVNVFRGYLDVVSHQVDNENLESYLERARGKATELVDISEKLQMINSIHPATATPQRVDLVSLVESEIDLFRSEHAEVAVETDLPDEAWIVGDDGLHHAIREILANTVAHHESSLADCEVDVAISTDGNHVTLEVTDNGPGIPQEEVEAIREGEETQLLHASGVGLWLVNWLCHRHGGDVHVDSGSGGSAVTLQFKPSPNITNVGLLQSTRHLRSGAA